MRKNMLLFSKEFLLLSINLFSKRRPIISTAPRYARKDKRRDA